MGGQDIREQVINGLEKVAYWQKNNVKIHTIEEARELLEMLCKVDDAIDMLKSQEPMDINPISYGTNGVRKGSCPKCGDRINDYYNMAFCGKCGQAVKWR